MKNKWKKTGAALLIAGLTVSGTGYALADGKVIDLTVLKKAAIEESTVSPVKVVEEADTYANKGADSETINLSVLNADQEDGKTDSDKKDGSAEHKGTKESGDNKATETEENELPEIPEGYTAGNLTALAKAYEQVQNPNAKAAIKRNMERSIAKWESKQPVAETPKEGVKEETPKIEGPVKEEAPVQEEKPAKVKEKNPQAELNAKHKEQRKELKTAQKAERQTLKEEWKAEKEQQKEERKAAKGQQKQENKDNKN